MPAVGACAGSCDFLHLHTSPDLFASPLQQIEIQDLASKPMPTPAPTDPNASQNPAPAQSFDEHKLHDFWVKNSRSIYIFCIIVVAGILAWELYGYYRRGAEKRIGSAYAAATTPEKLKAFATANAGHELAGAAHLRLADEAYSAGNYTQAIASYKAAAGTIKTGPLGGRARLGAAVASLQAGSTADGESQLKQIAGDATQMKAVRAEACYHLATLAVAAGRSDDALKLLEQLNTIEPAGLWAQRALALRASLPAPVAQVAAPSVSLPAKP